MKPCGHKSKCKNTKKLRNKRFFKEKKANIANSLCICMVKEPIEQEYVSVTIQFPGNMNFLGTQTK